MAIEQYAPYVTYATVCAPYVTWYTEASMASLLVIYNQPLIRHDVFCAMLKTSDGRYLAGKLTSIRPHYSIRLYKNTDKDESIQDERRFKR